MPTQDEPYCPALQRVFDRWAEGQRARDWSTEDLKEALRVHRQQWQEVWVRMLMGYQAFDTGQYEVAQAQFAYSCRSGKDLWPPDEPCLLILQLEWAFVTARAGSIHPEAEEWLKIARQVAGSDIQLPFVMTRLEAAHALLHDDPRAINHIEAAASWVRSQPDTEMDSWLAELDWLQAMRNEFYERGLG